MEPIEQLSVILPAISDLVDRVEADQLHHDTPCTNFDLSGVLDHMIGLGGTFSYLFRGEEPPSAEAGDVVAGDHNGDVPAATFRRVMLDLLDSVRSDGAMERILPTPLGPMPGETFARLVAFDGLVHGWDIARASGQPWELPDEVVAAVDLFARNALTDDLRDGDTFKVATTPPVDATPIERVAAFSGRTV